MGNAHGSGYPRPSDLSTEERAAALGGVPTIEAVARKLSNGEMRDVVLMFGAGVSVNAGIPDFRSPESGLYNRLEHLGLPCPEAVFHIEYFKQHPEPFYCLSKELLPGNFRPTLAHLFAVLLQEKGLLRRLYTQNIDNLELLAGVREEKLVEAHGSFRDVHCIKCRKQFRTSWYRERLLENRMQRCNAQTPLTCGIWRHKSKFMDREGGLLSGSSGSKSSSEADEERRALAVARAKARAAVIEEEKIRQHQERDRQLVDEQQSPHPLSKVAANFRDSPSKIAADFMQRYHAACAETKAKKIAEGHEISSNEEKNDPLAKTTDSPTEVRAKRPDSEEYPPEPQKFRDVPLHKAPTPLASGPMPTVAEAKAGCCGGLIKPDITFFGEGLPPRFGQLCDLDLPAADLLIIMGTSLQVHPFCSLVTLTNPTCPRLLINNELVGQSACNGEDGMLLCTHDDNYRDIFMEGDCDKSVRKLCQLLGWSAELKALESRTYTTEEMWKLIDETQQKLEFN